MNLGEIWTQCKYTSFLIIFKNSKKRLFFFYTYKEISFFLLIWFPHYISLFFLITNILILIFDVLFLNNVLEPVCCKKQQKSSWPVTGLGNRGPLKDLNNSKLIVYESKWFPWSSRINFISFRIFIIFSYSINQWLVRNFCLLFLTTDLFGSSTVAWI